jgi:hypothetical protein
MRPFSLTRVRVRAARRDFGALDRDIRIPGLTALREGAHSVDQFGFCPFLGGAWRCSICFC